MGCKRRTTEDGQQEDADNEQEKIKRIRAPISNNDSQRNKGDQHAGEKGRGEESKWKDIGEVNTETNHEGRNAGEST